LAPLVVVEVRNYDHPYIFATKFWTLLNSVLNSAQSMLPIERKELVSPVERKNPEFSIDAI